MAEKKVAKGWARCYLVAHPELPTVPVTAESWELATVKAAELWGVPWGKVVAECILERMTEVKAGVCAKCKQVMYNRPGQDFCEVCEKKMKQDSENVARRMKKTWYLAPKKI